MEKYWKPQKTNYPHAQCKEKRLKKLWSMTEPNKIDVEEYF